MCDDPFLSVLATGTPGDELHLTAVQSVNAAVVEAGSS